MDIAQLTTVYDARDEQHRAVTDRVIARERAATAEVAAESNKKVTSAEAAVARAASTFEASAGYAAPTIRRARTESEQAITAADAAVTALTASAVIHSSRTAAAAQDAVEKASKSAKSSAEEFFQATQGYVPTIKRQADEAVDAVHKVADAVRTSKVSADDLIPYNYKGAGGQTFEEFDRSGAGGLSAAEQEYDRRQEEKRRKRIEEAQRQRDWLSMPTHPSTTVTNAEAQGAVKSLEAQRTAAEVAEWKRKEDARVAATKKAEKEIEDAVAAGARVRENWITRIPIIGRAFSGAKEAAGDVTTLAKAEGAAAASAGELSGSVGGAAASLGTMGGVITVVLVAVAASVIAYGLAAKAVWEVTHAAAEAEGKLHDLHLTTGLNVETLSALDYAARLGGTSVQQLSSGIIIFNRNLQAAQAGQGKARDSFKSLNVDLRDQDAALNAVLDRLASLPEGSQRSAEAMKFFGRSGAQMLKVLDESGGSLEKLQRELRATGQLITGEQAEAADRFGDKWDKIAMKLEAAGRQIGDRLMPTLEHLADETDKQFGQAGRTVTVWGVLVDTVAQKVETDINFMTAALAPMNRDLTMAALLWERISRYTRDVQLPEVPAPKMITDPLPIPTVDNPSQQAEQVVQVAKREAQEAERQLRETQQRQQDLVASGAATVRQSAAVQLEASRKTTEARVTQLRAEKQLLEERKKELDGDVNDTEAHRDKILGIEGQINDKEQQILDARSNYAMEAARRAREVREDDLRRRREYLQATAQLIARETQSFFSATNREAQRSYDRSMIGVDELTERRRIAEEGRYAGERASMAKERMSAETILDPDQKARAIREYDQKAREAERNHQQAMADIDQEGYLRRIELDKSYAEGRIRWLAAANQNEVTRRQADQRRGALSNEEVEDISFGLQQNIFKRRKDQITVDLARNMFDPDKLRETETAMDELLQEIEAAQLAHNRQTQQAREQDLDDAQRHAQGLRAIYGQVSDLNAQVLREQVDLLRENNFERASAREAQRILDRAMEAARIARTLAELNAQLRKAALIEDPRQRVSTERSVSAQIEAEKRASASRMRAIDHRAALERREEMVQTAHDIADILSAGLNEFQGDWSDVWRGMLNEALNVVRRIADELMKMSLEVLLSGSTQGSASSGILGILVNSIGGALFGNLLNSGSVPTHNSSGPGGPGGINWLSPPPGGGGFTFSPGHARGGKNVTGWSVVGEEGPELAYFGVPTDIFSHDQSANMAASGRSGGGGGDTYYITTPAPRSSNYVQKKASRETAELIQGTLKTRRKMKV